MSKKRENQSAFFSAGRYRNTSILTIAFAIAMALFLVIGLIATALPQFLADDNPGENQPVAQDQGVSEEEQLRARLDEHPDDVSAMVRLADLLANTGQYEQSIRWYERAIERRPDQAGLRISFAWVLQQADYLFDAEVQLERALELAPNNVEAVFMLAEIMEQDEPPREAEALELYNQVIETAPESYYAELARERLEIEDEGESDEE